MTKSWRFSDSPGIAAIEVPISLLSGGTSLDGLHYGTAELHIEARLAAWNGFRQRLSAGT
jgi:hypothetical protein